MGHGQYSTQPTMCTNELNVGGGVPLGCMCVCTIAAVHCYYRSSVCACVHEYVCVCILQLL